ncbi:aldose 1-epimerase family protein [Algoriphagus vanfongensis]|uniref:aldose 1-epimerase family protein n=1 Tax=Algoriphagus vanfongensis TaxID=426371 RepID=UPI00041BC35B|nr:aldose 1-epimerase family protein [Algoriphagus vanfongensis]
MTYTIESDSLQVQIKQQGMELSSILSKETHTEYLWQGDPQIWSGQAPVLFPIIGALKGGTYSFKGQEYSLPKHGFVRTSDQAKVIRQEQNLIVFRLESNEDTKAIYPFDFVFDLSFELIGKKLRVSHRIENTGNEEMFYSLGGHPAFNCPIGNGGKLEDYSIEFPELENDHTWNIMPGGLIGGMGDKVLNDSQTIQLTDHIFDGDALVFKHLKSREVSLHHQTRGPLVSLEFNDFDYLGIWAKPGAPYVCLEPWLGIGDAEDHSGLFTDKDGIRALKAGQVEEKSFSVEILE